MPVDYNSLLVALAFSGTSILMVALASWMNARKDSFMIFGAIGVCLFTVSTVLLALRNGPPDAANLIAPYTLLLAGVAFVYASTRLFRHRTSLWLPAVVGVIGIAATGVPLMTGFLGLGALNLNIAVAVILLLSAMEFWRAFWTSKEDLRSATLANAILYFLTGMAFAASAVSRTIGGEMVLYPPSDNWVELINAMMSLVGVTGIGALTLVLHFARTARQHHAEAYTDALTGVLNRRALFERFAEDDVIPGVSVLQFDLDYFKQINDQLGHAQGDATLQKFAEIMRPHLGKCAVVARTGGEEFCMVISGPGSRAARATAECIRMAFAELGLPSGRQDAVATVSVGLASGGDDEPFASVLKRADAALYKAKHAGRNKVHQALQRLAAA